MQSHAARRLIWAFLFVLPAPPAFAQLIPGWDAKQFTIEQLDAERVKLVREVEVIGVGPNAGQQIFADEIEWNRRTGEFVAVGNVVLVSPTSRLSAERVVFNTKTQLGTFETAWGMASLGAQGQKDRSMFGTLEPDVYFYGETIDKIGRDKYRITKGGFTTCVQPTPRWDIVSNRATIDLGDYAILKNAVMRVKDVPVFYLPVLYYPIQDDDRATGFLLPTYGTSTYRGQSLSNAFFWAINRSQDATVFHDLFMKRGQGAGMEYRYVLSPGADGFLRSYWLNEKPTVIEVPGRTSVPQAARRSYTLEARLVQPLPARLTARANVDYFSDVATQQLYNVNIYDATRSQRVFGGGVTGSWGRVNLTANYNRSEYFTSQTSSETSGTEPGVIVSFASTRIRQLPLYFALTSDAARTVYINRRTAGDGSSLIDDLGLGRVDLSPSLRAPLTKWPFLTLNTTVSYRSTYFSESLDRPSTAPGTPLQLPVGIWRRYGDVRAEVTGPVFSKVYSPQNAFAERLKHLIEPNFSIQRITRVTNQDLVPARSVYDSVVGDTTRVMYGITNRILIRQPPPATTTEGGLANPIAGAPRELLSVSISQSYYSDPRASQVDPTLFSYGFRPPSKFSPIVLNARSAPTELSTASVIAEYDASKGVLQTIAASGGISHKAVQARGGWSNRVYGPQGRTNSLDANSTFAVFNGRLGGTYSMNWDITRRQILQQRWVGNYNAQCCGVAIEFQEVSFGLGSIIPKDRRFNLSFTLAGIGSFSNFFGAFGAGGARRY